MKNEYSDHDLFPLLEAPNVKSRYASYTIVELTTKYRAYMELKGRFPYTSSGGNQYILIGYHFDGNEILVKPLKNWQSGEITKAQNKLNTTLKYYGIQPNTYIIDNEASV